MDLSPFCPRWDLSIGLGRAFGFRDIRVSQNMRIIILDDSMTGLNRTGSYAHEGVHYLVNRFLPGLVGARRRKHLVGEMSFRGFLASNLRFYEESLAYTIGGTIGSLSREGLCRGRLREVIGLVPAWRRELRNPVARVQVLAGLPVIVGVGYYAANVAFPYWVSE